MRFDYQNLYDGPLRRWWSHGRAWIRFGEEWYERRFGEVRVEWAVPARGCSWAIVVGGDDDGRSLSVHASIPFIANFYVTVSRFFSRRPFAYDFDAGSDRRIGVSIDGGVVHYDIWVGSMASYSRSYPWCRWWRQGSVELADLALGKARYSDELIRGGIPVEIPMPEGIYRGTAKVTLQTWNRPLWFPRRLLSTWIDIPGGIPFAGKGESEYDCGDDGIFGKGFAGDSVEAAVGDLVGEVLDRRRRYGNASEATIREALARSAS